MTKVCVIRVLEKTLEELLLDKYRMSYRAFKSALMIMLHRDRPVFAMPYLILTKLMDVDSLLMKWRCKCLQG